MKKYIVIALFTTVFTSLSCRKTRTCECLTKSSTEFIVGTGSNTSNSESSYKITKNKQKKGDFKKMEKCYGTKSTNTTVAGTSTTIVTLQTSCTIK